MQATRRVEVEESEKSKDHPKDELVKYSAIHDKVEELEKSEDKEEKVGIEDGTGQDDTEPPSLEKLSFADFLNKAPSKSTTETKSKPKDPLYWFGILVPPALRSAQSSFVGAVDVIPKLVSVQEEMRIMEIEIRRARKAATVAAKKKMDAKGDEEKKSLGGKIKEKAHVIST
jgi:coiled-coil domain-containing protein 115